MGRWRLAGTAQAQITEILRESEACWGAAAAERYLTLLLTAMQDVADAPDRPGARVFEGGLRLYHIRHCRDRVPDPPGRVGRPHHVLIYEVSGPGLVDVLGLFFDGIPPRLGIRRALGGLD